MQSGTPFHNPRRAGLDEPPSTVGDNVTTVSPGDSVLLSYTSCSSCPSCKSKKPYACPQWQVMNFGRQRSVELGNKAGAVMADGKGEEVYGAFFGQSSMGRMALVSEASVSSYPKL